jgi:hypothetical protein
MIFDGGRPKQSGAGGRAPNALLTVVGGSAALPGTLEAWGGHKRHQETSKGKCVAKASVEDAGRNPDRPYPFHPIPNSAAAAWTTIRGVNW